MIDALQQELGRSSALLDLYIRSAKLEALIRDTTTQPTESDKHLVFLPEAVYPQLLERFAAVVWPNTERVAIYLAERSAVAFLRFVDTGRPELIDRSLADIPEPEGSEVAARLAIRLAEGPSLFDARRQEIVRGALQAAVDEYGWFGFLDIDGIATSLPTMVQAIVRKEVDEGFPSLDRLYEWFAQDLSSREHVEGAMEGIESHCRRLGNEVRGDDTQMKALNAAREFADSRLDERHSEMLERKYKRADYDGDAWKEHYYESKYELEHGRFADVDE